MPIYIINNLHNTHVNVNQYFRKPKYNLKDTVTISICITVLLLMCIVSTKMCWINSVIVLISQSDLFKMCSCSTGF